MATRIIAAAYFDPNDAALAFGNDPGYFRGDRVKFDWQGNIRVMAGADRDVRRRASARYDQRQRARDRRRSPTMPASRSCNRASASGSSTRRACATTATASSAARRPIASRRPCSIPETGTKLKGSVGTGFKAPTLDPALRQLSGLRLLRQSRICSRRRASARMPASSRSCSIAASRSARPISTTTSRTSSTSTTPSRRYVNVGQATTYGVESFVAL